MDVTLNDVAKLVGVSQNTVSRALRGKPDISADTTERVQKVAQMIGYRPNGASRALRNRAFYSIGMVTGGANEFYLPNETLGTFSQTLARNNYTCSLLCATAIDAEHLYESPLLKARLVDAMVIAYVCDLAPEAISRIAGSGIPAIWLHRKLESDCIIVDEDDAVEQLMAHLFECGYRRVMLVDYSTGGENWVAQMRLRGLDFAAERLDMEPLRLVHRRIPREQRFEVTRNWLTKPNRPEAVIVTEITAAQVVLETALHLGLRVPEDLAICTLDDGRRYDAHAPSFTAAIRPEAKFGIAAAEMAIAKAQNPDEPLPPRSVKYTLAIGGSTVASKSVVSQWRKTRS